MEFVMSRPWFESKVTRSLVVAGTLMCVPALTSAQSSSAQIPVRIRNSVPRNTCLQIESMPSPLVGSPEGMVILRMQRELSNVAASMAARSNTKDARPGMRRALMLKHGVDSLARAYAQSMDTASRPVSVNIDGRGNFEGVRMSSIESMRDPVEMRIRELEPQVRELARGQNAMSVEMVLSRTSHAPGYLGVTASSGALTSFDDGIETVSYCDYPMVESMEAGSPADKAGIQTGDTLLAYNGRDLRQYDVNYSQLLVPGKTVTIRLRRDGKARDIPVVVGRRSAQPAASAPELLPCGDDEARAACEARVTVSVQGFVLPPGSAPPPFAEPAKPTGNSASARTRVSAGIPLTISATSGAGLAEFAGARVTAISSAFAANLGVAQGLLVMDVASGSPGADSGLHPGDVIIEVNGIEVKDVLGLRRALTSMAHEHSASMQVSGKSSSAARAGGQSGVRSVVVRW
jgi:serine protease Do